ncbi:glycerate kinase [Ornithinimicrobium sp. LYQ103]|uniref:glycerate kinase n=1 Tax=Ornithinimicrobium sp. LYQ103 TaxID=3378796 RepID=UPI003853198C
MSRRPRVLLAPDKFKGTLTGVEAAEAMAAGVRAAMPDADVRIVPLADGGEGTVDAVLAAGAEEHEHTVAGPLGSSVSARLALRGRTAVVEAAQACGLQLLDPTPATALAAHSTGVGELIRLALGTGAERIVVGLGGVACTDGGAGMACALGARLLDASGRPLPQGGGSLADLASVDLGPLRETVGGATFVAATDVTNPLLGPHGAAGVYAPQKGAGPAEVRLLEAGLTRWAQLTEDLGATPRDLPGGGAAGGLGWGMVALLGAGLSPGADLVMDLVGMDEALAWADLVVTGEGKLDRQSTYGKGPVALARSASDRGLPVLGIGGAVEHESWADHGFTHVSSLVELVGEEQALRSAGPALQRATEAAVRRWMDEDTAPVVRAD